MDNYLVFHLDGGEIIGDIEVRLHPDVIASVNDEWRSKFYSLDTPEEIAGHIAYNAIANSLELSSMDGFADLPDNYAEVEIL